MRRARVEFAAVVTLALAGGGAGALALEATMQRVTAEGTGETIGTVRIEQGPEGTVFTPDLRGLPPGERGFHVHESGECGPGPNPEGQVVPAGAAGGHWDSDDAERHEGPTGDGHLGDLPPLQVGEDGSATEPVTAPRIEDPSRLEGLALMIHQGGDNFSDEPQRDGGGGTRIACGVIEATG